jgi:hypothetical protein
MHLTYRSDSDSHSVAPPDSCEAGAPEHKIEITPEMIKAGALALLDVHSLEWEAEGAAVRYILKGVFGSRVKFSVRQS